MDLAQIRDMVLQHAPGRKPTVVDDMINLAQRQYIQSVARLEGLTNYAKVGPYSETGEDNALDVTNTIYTATYKPFLPGTVVVYVGGVEKETTDAGFIHTIDNDAGTVTFVDAQADVTIDYETEDSVLKTAIASDLYRMAAVKIILSGGSYTDIPLLPYSDADHTGLRQYNDRIYFQGIVAGQMLAIQYWRKLSDLGTATGQVSTPQIDEQWHDLYWMGALSMLRPQEWMGQFLDRLDAFKRDRIDLDSPHGGRRRPIRW